MSPSSMLVACNFLIEFLWELEKESEGIKYRFSLVFVPCLAAYNFVSMMPYNLIHLNCLGATLAVAFGSFIVVTLVWSIIPRLRIRAEWLKLEPYSRRNYEKSLRDISNDLRRKYGAPFKKFNDEERD